MTELLEDSINNIDSLNDFYMCQYDYIVRRAVKSKENNKYGLALDKFFYKQTNPETEISFSEEEKALIDEILEDYSIKPENDSFQVTYKLKDSFSKEGFEIDPVKAREKAICLYQQQKYLSESVLMMLLIKYEESISSIFRYIIEKYPQAFLSKKSITYSELISMKTDFEGIKRRFVDNEIDEIMREPISDWYSAFETKHKASFLFADNLFDRFKEIYYRRNLVVHNQGKVNDIYLTYVKNTSAKVGDILYVDRKYLQEAFSLTSLILVDTCFGLRGLADDKGELASWIINEYGYKCLVEKKWEKAKYIYKVVLQDKTVLAADFIVATINYWIATKNIDGVSAIQEEVNSLDVSSLRLSFATAKHALLNNHKEVSELLDECLEKRELSANSIKTWPLFNEFRESDEYSKFIEKHKKEFEFGSYVVPSDDEASLLKDAEQEDEEHGDCQ